MKLVTERLLLRPWRAEDVDALTEIHADAEVMRWLGGARDRDRTADIVERWTHGLELRGFGFLAAEDRRDGELLGMIGLSVPEFLPEILPAVEVGWRLRRDRWGLGLATEGARACVGHAFGALEIERLVAICQRENAASRRVAEKLGMRLERETVVPGDGTPIVLYALEREVGAG